MIRGSNVVFLGQPKALNIPPKISLNTQEIKRHNVNPSLAPPQNVLNIIGRYLVVIINERNVIPGRGNA
jgi:hypothetical protein